MVSGMGNINKPSDMFPRLNEEGGGVKVGGTRVLIARLVSGSLWCEASSWLKTS